MIIRKKYSFESAHIVRGASSERCRYSIHGHSYKVEVELESHMLNPAHMVIDFIDLKPIKDLIDLFDHSYMLGLFDEQDYVKAIIDNSSRVIKFNFNPTAESIAMFILIAIDTIISLNMLGAYAKVESVTVHETATGSATATYKDINNLNLNNGKRFISLFQDIDNHAIDLYFNVDESISNLISIINSRYVIGD